LTAATISSPLALDARGTAAIAGHAVHWRLGTVPGASRADLSALARAWLEEIVNARDLFAWNGLTRASATAKPRPRNAPDADVSISHSSTMLLVGACADARIGVDIEAGPFRAFDSPALVRRMCTPHESTTAQSLDDDARRRYLARVWTSKEAQTKATGTGLVTDFRTLDSGARPHFPLQPFEAHLAVADRDAVLHAHTLVLEDSRD